MSWQFTVGLRVKRKADRIVVDAEDALIAALKVKTERPEATILYVRRSNPSLTRRSCYHQTLAQVIEGKTTQCSRVPSKVRSKTSVDLVLLQTEEGR